MGKIIALAAGKGGTGKTLLTAALGERLAARGEQVCLLDACAGLRGLDLSLGLQDQMVFDWLDLSREDCAMEQALLRGVGEGQPYLLAAPQDLLPEEFMRTHTLRSVWIEYRKELPRGTESELTYSLGGSTLYVRGTAENKERFLLRMEYDETV